MMATSSITETQLTQRCDWVRRRALRYLQTTGHILIELYFGKGRGPYLLSLQHPVVTASINDAHSKTMLFAMLRHMVEAGDYDCFIFTCDSWYFEPSQQFHEQSQERRHELLKLTTPKLFELGYMSRDEAIVVNGQTPAFFEQSVIKYKRAESSIEIIGNIHHRQDESTYRWNLHGRMALWDSKMDSLQQRAYDALKQQRYLDLMDVCQVVDITKDEP